MLTYALRFQHGLHQAVRQTEFSQPPRIELNEGLAYILERVHFLLAPGLARSRFPFGIVCQILFQGASQINKLLSYVINTSSDSSRTALPVVGKLQCWIATQYNPLTPELPEVDHE